MEAESQWVNSRRSHRCQVTVIRLKLKFTNCWSKISSKSLCLLTPWLPYTFSWAWPAWWSSGEKSFCTVQDYLTHLEVSSQHTKIERESKEKNERWREKKERKRTEGREGGKERKVGERGRDERINFALGSNQGVGIASLTQWTWTWANSGR